MAIKQIITIGRGSDQSYQLDRDSISVEHAMIIVSSKGKYLLVDCNSTNGTRLPLRSGAARVSQVEVNLDDMVLFGDEELQIRDLVNIGSVVQDTVSGSEFTLFRDPIDGSIKRKSR
jgi:pSer/pThr/pTyr-binding forkhead associated (FHA) protein